MITVVLRDGRVLQYNEGKRVVLFNGCFNIENDKSGVYARFPMDVVERTECAKPCRILKESRDKKKMKKY